MALSVVKEDNRFRVEWQGNSIDWLPDIPSTSIRGLLSTSNRKAMVVILRLLQNEKGKRVFTFQEWFQLSLHEHQLAQNFRNI